MLIVDMLNNNIPLSKITGILITKAHKITSLSLESFILTVYRKFNKNGFIKAFSESPEQFTMTNTTYKKKGQDTSFNFLKKITKIPHFFFYLIFIFFKGKVTFYSLKKKKGKVF
jgi:hypothetical protein